MRMLPVCQFVSAKWHARRKGRRNPDGHVLQGHTECTARSGWATRSSSRSGPSRRVSLLSRRFRGGGGRCPGESLLKGVLGGGRFCGAVVGPRATRGPGDRTVCVGS